MSLKGSIVSADYLRQDPSGSTMSSGDDTAKELSNVPFSPIEHGWYKHSVDHTGIDLDRSPLDPRNGVDRKEEGLPISNSENEGQQGEISAPRKLCGTRKKWIWVGGIIIIIIVAALIAGLRSGLIRPHGNLGHQNLAVANWTVENIAYHAVFTQSEHDGSLIAYT
ncbi:hypothetical protein F4778DRAFT_789914 [Xylariomycetidae sp. FL2044]|nr:hypothetical protein F4778DRAFT_789914 [Xylariomycetidae sp. FL2044]